VHVKIAPLRDELRAHRFRRLRDALLARRGLSVRGRGRRRSRLGRVSLLRGRVQRERE
jgi:hypothetical protein